MSQNVFADIRKWADARNLVFGCSQHAQMVKLMEEVGELANAIARKKESDIRDAIGDCIVVLTILAAQNGTLVESCVIDAYHTIKDRTGKMVDGIFVKDT